jgi:hypothetical protein
LAKKFKRDIRRSLTISRSGAVKDYKSGALGNLPAEAVATVMAMLAWKFYDQTQAAGE